MLKKNNFDLIRLFAAIQVMFFHTVEHLNLEIGFFKYFSSYRGVIIFFTISGYLIYLSYERNKNNLWQYIRNRVGRIFPALWVATIISFLILLISGYLDLKNIFNIKIWLYWLGQLSIFQFWTPDILRGYGVGTPNGSLWTITVEIQFYIIIFFLFRILKNMKWINTLTISSIILNMIVYSMLSKELLIVKLFGVTLVPYFYNFMLGVYFARYRNRLQSFLENKFIYWFIIYNLYVYGLKVYPSYYINFGSLISNVLLGIMILSFAFSFKNLSSFLLRGIDISYGIYLYHMLFLNYLIYKWQVNEKIDEKKILYYIFMTIIMAFLSYRYVEEPALKYLKKRGRNEETKSNDSSRN